jgi:hypothetical protein
MEGIMTRSIIFGSLVLAFIHFAPADKSKIEKELTKARLEAARNAYKAVEDLPSEDRNGEIRYIWSKRLLEAEKEAANDQAEVLAAYKTHYERMMKFKKVINDLQKSPDKLPLEITTSAEFYRIEAELWLERAEKRN